MELTLNSDLKGIAKSMVFLPEIKFQQNETNDISKTHP